MGQTVQNTPSSNVETLQTLQESVSNSKVPEMTVAQAIKHFELQREKLKKFLENEKNPELQKNAQNFLEALNKDIAVLQKQTNQDDRVTSIQQKLASLDFDLKKGQNPTPGVDIPVAKEAPKPLSTNIDSESTKYIQNFQAEAAAAFKQEISDENGNLTNQSIKKGLEFVAEVSNISSITLGDGDEKFNWLDKAEQEKLKEQLPAVRGVLGAIFMETLFGAWYVAAFNGDGTIVLKSKNTNNANTANTIEKEINTAFVRDPELSKTLRMGLLYADGDLLKYMQASADSKGQNISPNQQTPDEFLNYLHGRSKKEETQAADAIKASKSFFEGINLPEQMVAANAIPEISRALETIKAAEVPLNQQPQATGVAAAQTVPSANVATISRTQALATGMAAPLNSLDQYKTSGQVWEDFKDKPVATVFGGLGNIAGNGLKQLFSSPGVLGGAVIALFIGKWFTGSWGKSFTFIAGALGAAGLWERIGQIRDADKKFEQWGGSVKNPHATLRTTVPDEEVHKHVTKVQEHDEEAVKLLSSIGNEKFSEVAKYGDGADSKISDSAKQAIDSSPNGKEIVKKDVTDIKERLDKHIQLAFPNDPELQKRIYENLTLEDARRISLLSPEDAKSVAIAMLNSMMAAETDPVKKVEIQAMIEEITKASEDGTNWLVLSFMVILGIIGIWLIGWAAWRTFLKKFFPELAFKNIWKALKLWSFKKKKGKDGLPEDDSKKSESPDPKKSDSPDLKFKKTIAGKEVEFTEEKVKFLNTARKIYEKIGADGKFASLKDFHELKTALKGIDDVYKSADFITNLNALYSKGKMPKTLDDLLRQTPDEIAKIAKKLA